MNLGKREDFIPQPVPVLLADRAAIKGSAGNSWGKEPQNPTEPSITKIQTYTLEIALLGFQLNANFIALGVDYSLEAITFEIPE